MTIDWMNPTEDILEARRIGYDEASENMQEELDIMTERAEKAEAENQAMRDRLEHMMGNQSGCVRCGDKVAFAGAAYCSIACWEADKARRRNHENAERNPG